MAADWLRQIAGEHQLTRAIDTCGIGWVWRGCGTVLDSDIVELVGPVDRAGRSALPCPPTPAVTTTKPPWKVATSRSTAVRCGDPVALRLWMYGQSVGIVDPTLTWKVPTPRHIIGPRVASSQERQTVAAVLGVYGCVGQNRSSSQPRTADIHNRSPVSVRPGRIHGVGRQVPAKSGREASWTRQRPRRGSQRT